MTHFSSLLQLSGHWNSTAQSPLKSRLSSMEFFPKASGFGLWSLMHKVETHVSSRTYQRRAWVWGVLLSGWKLGSHQNTDRWRQWGRERAAEKQDRETGNGLPVTKGDADDQESARDRKGGVSGGGRGGAGLTNHHKLTLRVSGMGLGAPLGRDDPAWLTSLAHSRCTISV